MTKKEINDCLEVLKEPLITIESGWFRNLNSRKLESLKKLYKHFSGEDLNIYCLKCVKRGLRYVKKEKDKIH